MAENGVSALGEADVEAAGRVLCSAFQDDPLQRYVFPDSVEREQRSLAQFTALVREACLFGKAFATKA